MWDMRPKRKISCPEGMCSLESPNGQLTGTTTAEGHAGPFSIFLRGQSSQRCRGQKGRIWDLTADMDHGEVGQGKAPDPQQVLLP